MEPENPFDDPAIQAQIDADIARVWADFYAWHANPTDGSLEDKAIERVVAQVDAAGRGYLTAVNTESQIPEYLARLRQNGEKLIRREQEYQSLHNPYSEAKLRALAESSGRVVKLKITGPPEAYKDALEAALTYTRVVFRDKISQEIQQRNGLMLRIALSVKSRYGHWKAEAIERVRRSMERAAEAVDKGRPSNPLNRKEVHFVDDRHRYHVTLMRQILSTTKWDVWLLENPQNPPLQLSTMMRYMAGTIKGLISDTKRLEIETAIINSAKRLGLV